MAVSIKILIVDDDRDLADEWMKAKLERHPDISVVATCSVERDMLSLVELHNPDVVLIDMM